MADSIFKIPKLSNSDDWDIWSLRIEAILIEKGYLDVCQTSEEAFIESIANLDPREGEARLEAHRALSLKALAYIRLALADGPLLQTKSIRDPYKLLKALGGLYESKGFSSEFILCKSLINTTLSNSKGNLEFYLQNIRRLVNDLESKNISLPTNFVAALVLNNLSKEYDYIVTIITQTIRENSIVNLDAIFSQLIDESRRLKYNNRGSYNKDTSNIDTSTSREIEMSNSTKGTKTSNNSKNLVCSYCSKKGHIEDKCFKKHPNLRPNRNVSTTTTVEENEVEETVVSTSISKSSNFVLDSAATIHICCDKELFDYINPVNTSIKWGNNTSNTIKASGIGDISLKFLSTDQNAKLTGVLYIPELRVNLISLALLAKKDITLNFTKDYITIYKPNSKAVLARGLYKDNVVSFKVASNKRDSSLQDRNIVLSTQSTYNPWHQRLGHIGGKALMALPNNVQGLNVDFSKYTDNFRDCETCIKSKGTQKINREVSTKPYWFLEKVTIDIGGPIKPTSSRGFRYYITFLDAATGYLEVTLLKDRSNTSIAIESFINKAENLSSYTLKRLHCDNEFKTRDIESLALRKGFEITTSAPYTPEQKGAGERINRTLFNKVRALLITSNLALKYWNEALLSAVYLYNRTPHSSYQFRTPYEVRYSKKPDLSNIKTWGSLAYKKEPIEHLNKLDARTTPYYLIGYSTNQYKLLDPSTSKTIYARDVYVIENKFYKEADLEEDQNIFEKVEIKDLETIDLDLESTIQDKDLSIDIPIEDRTTEVDDHIDIEDIEPIKAREHTTQEEFYNQLLDYSVLATSSIDSEPTTLQEVLEHPDKDKYLDAIEVEIKGLEHNNTWTLVPRPKDKPVLKGRLVFKKKLKANGNLDKYKARYVVKGFLQKQGINYNETFASTTKPISLRLLLAIATLLDLEVYKGDVKQAFAVPAIDAEVYLEQPPLYNKDKNLVCRLNKALYGLKQAARQWQKHINSILLSLGFKCLISDNSIYSHETKGIILAVYVDDILVFARDTTTVDKLFTDLRDKDLDISNLGPVKEFLGIEINRTRDTRSLSISQEGYIIRLLERYNKTKLKPLKKPYIEGRILDGFDGQASKDDILQYQKEIGALIYLTIYTRVDLAFRVGQLARFMSNPSSDHFQALNDVWAYLNTTKSYAIGFSMFNKQSTLNDLNIIGYTDADWGGDIATRKSTSGYINLLSSKLNKDYKGSITFPISWNSKLQKTVALSSCEAEYMAYKESFKETIYINSLLSELPRNIQDLFSKTNIVYTDSQSAIQLAKDPMFHSRTKHVSIRYYFIKEKVISKEIDLIYCPTDKLLADGLTKTISTPKWFQFIDGLGLIPYKA